MKNIFKRFCIFALACVLCLSTSLVAFAAETDTGINVATGSEESSTYGLGNLLTTGGISDLRTSSTCTVYLSSANWSADFVVNVHGNQNANYYVTLIRPNGNSDTQLIGGNGGSAKFTLAYAPAGTYTITVTRHQGVDNYAYAVVQVFD